MQEELKCSNCTNNGYCSKCGECCTPFIPITRKEYKRIKKYIDENNIKPTNIREGNNVYIKCTFYDRENKRCNIYPVRPEVCKKFMCSYSEEKIDKNRKYFDERAEINGNTEKIMPMELLFYNKIDTLIYFIQARFKPKDEEHFIWILNKIGRNDVANAIERGIIKLTWEEETKC